MGLDLAEMSVVMAVMAVDLREVLGGWWWRLVAAAAAVAVEVELGAHRLFKMDWLEPHTERVVVEPVYSPLKKKRMDTMEVMVLMVS